MKHQAERNNIAKCLWFVLLNLKIFCLQLHNICVSLCVVVFVLKIEIDSLRQHFLQTAVIVQFFHVSATANKLGINKNTRHLLRSYIANWINKYC